MLNLADIFVVIPRLQPRFYSISSSSIHSPSKITITVGVLNTETSIVSRSMANYHANLVGSQD